MARIGTAPFGASPRTAGPGGADSAQRFHRHARREDHRSVSRSPLIERTCGLPASGSATGFTPGHTNERRYAADAAVGRRAGRRPAQPESAWSRAGIHVVVDGPIGIRLTRSSGAATTQTHARYRFIFITVLILPAAVLVSMGLLAAAIGAQASPPPCRSRTAARLSAPELPGRG